MTDHIPTEFEVELPSGRYFDVLTPDPAQLRLTDVAIMLAKDCRYGGACRGWYSVAEHAVLVSEKLERLGVPLRLQFAGLHHDDAEFVTKDIQRPVKLAKRALSSDRDAAEKKLTAIIDNACWLTFGIHSSMPLWQIHEMHDEEGLVKFVDNWACVFEARHIMPSGGRGWEQTWLLDQATRPIPEHENDRIYGWEWKTAAEMWMNRHAVLLSRATRLPAAVAA